MVRHGGESGRPAHRPEHGDLVLVTGRSRLKAHTNDVTIRDAVEEVLGSVEVRGGADPVTFALETKVDRNPGQLLVAAHSLTELVRTCERWGGACCPPTLRPGPLPPPSPFPPRTPSHSSVLPPVLPHSRTLVPRPLSCSLPHSRTLVPRAPSRTPALPAPFFQQPRSHSCCCAATPPARCPGTDRQSGRLVEPSSVRGATEADGDPTRRTYAKVTLRALGLCAAFRPARDPLHTRANPNLDRSPPQRPAPASPSFKTEQGLAARSEESP